MGIHRVHIPTYNWGAAVLWPCLIEEMRINQLTEWGTLFSDKTSTHLTRNLCKRAMCSGTSTHWNLMLRFQLGHDNTNWTVWRKCWAKSAFECVRERRIDNTTTGWGHNQRIRHTYITENRCAVSHSLTWQKVGKAKSRSKGTSVAQAQFGPQLCTVRCVCFHGPVHLKTTGFHIQHWPCIAGTMSGVAEHNMQDPKAAPFRGVSMLLPLINGSGYPIIPSMIYKYMYIYICMHIRRYTKMNMKL